MGASQIRRRFPRLTARATYRVFRERSTALVKRRMPSGGISGAHPGFVPAIHGFLADG
jgi:hypothetical protein